MQTASLETLYINVSEETPHQTSTSNFKGVFLPCSAIIFWLVYISACTIYVCVCMFLLAGEPISPINFWAATLCPSHTRMLSAAEYTLRTVYSAVSGSKHWEEFMEDFLDSCDSKGTRRKWKKSVFYWVGAMKNTPTDVHIQIFSGPE